MASLKTSILLPSAYRPQRLAYCLNALYSTLDNNDVEIMVSCIEDDRESLSVARSFSPDSLFVRTVSEYNRGVLWALHQMLFFMRGDALIGISDDQDFTEHWLTYALKYIEAGAGLVGLNDLSSDGNEYAAHAVASRAFIVEQMGGVIAPPQYFCWWFDRELTDRAKAAGLYAWAQDAIVDHLHYSFGKSEIDRTYADAIPHHDADRKVYQARKMAGYPIDYEAILQ